MKEPENHELKLWLLGCRVVAIRVFGIWQRLPCGEERTDYHWEMTNANGEKKSAPVSTLLGLVDYWVVCNSLIRVKENVIKEVEEYAKFCKTEARDLAEYKRLKAKFDE